MPKEYFSKSTKKYFTRENITRTGSGTTVPQTDQITESLDKYRETLQSFTTHSAAEIVNAPDGREVTVGGIVAAVKTMTDKKGSLMAFATLEDFSGALELILFSKCYEKYQDVISVDRMVLVTGRVSTREGEAAKLLGSELLPLEKLTERYDCQLVIKLDAGFSDKRIEEALAVLEQSRGKVPVLLAARENGSEVYIRSRKYMVHLDFALLNRLKELLGDSGAYLRPLGAVSNGQTDSSQTKWSGRRQ